MYFSKQSQFHRITHLVFYFEKVNSSKERLVSDSKPEGVVSLGEVKLDSFRFAALVVWKEVPGQADIQKVIADWFQQHLRF